MVISIFRILLLIIGGGGTRATRGVDVASVVEMKSLTESWPVTSWASFGLDLRRAPRTPVIHLGNE